MLTVHVYLDQTFVEQTVPELANKLVGHAWAVQVSATSQTPATPLQTNPSLLDQAAWLTAVLQIWQEFPLFTVPFA